MQQIHSVLLPMSSSTILIIGSKRRTPKEFFQKYFFAGQKICDESSVPEWELDQPDFLYDNIRKYRKPLSMILPAVIAEIVYWLLALHYDFCGLLLSRYEMSIVMIFGSFIGGATAEGGGAFAFPIMTLILNVPPRIARDFSVMIQSVGLTAAASSIFAMGIVVEWHAIVFSSMGGALGTIFTIEYIDHLLSPNVKKIVFVSFFFSFAMALYLLNSEKKRITVDRIHKFTWQKALILTANGFIGGFFTGISGSGLDAYTFSVLCLFFRISEKVSTPTTVSLMGFNSLFCFFWRHHMQNAIEPLAWEYFAACVPIVVIFAPIGSFLSSYSHRMTLACLIYFLETTALISAYIILRPSLELASLSIGIIAVSFVYYYLLVKIGRKNIPETAKEWEELNRIAAVKEPFDA